MPHLYCIWLQVEVCIHIQAHGKEKYITFPSEDLKPLR